MHSLDSLLVIFYVFYHDFLVIKMAHLGNKGRMFCLGLLKLKISSSAIQDICAKHEGCLVVKAWPEVGISLLHM